MAQLPCRAVHAAGSASLSDGRAIDLFDRFAKRRLAYADAERWYPGVAAHLAACDAYAQDFDGLLRQVMWAG